MYRLELPPSLYMYQLQWKENRSTNNFCSKKAFSLSSCKPNICFYSFHVFFLSICILVLYLHIPSTTWYKLQAKTFFKIWRWCHRKCKQFFFTVIFIRYINMHTKIHIINRHPPNTVGNILKVKLLKSILVWNYSVIEN